MMEKGLVALGSDVGAEIARTVKVGGEIKQMKASWVNRVIRSL